MRGICPVGTRWTCSAHHSRSNSVWSRFAPAQILRMLFARKPNGALIVFSSAITTANRNLIIDLAARHRLPTIYPFKSYTVRGGLISYGIDPLDMFRRAASYTDRILRGTSPGELPVQAPTK